MTSSSSSSSRLSLPKRPSFNPLESARLRGKFNTPFPPLKTPVSPPRFAPLSRANHAPRLPYFIAGAARPPLHFSLIPASRSRRNRRDHAHPFPRDLAHRRTPFPNLHCSQSRDQNSTAFTPTAAVFIQISVR